MADKSLKDKAMQIKGKDYVQVKDRILFLSNEGGNYSVETNYDYFPDHRMWVVKATLTTETGTYTGLAQEIESDDYKSVNSTSALENCETSAVGRACAMAGIGVLDSIASVDEIHKATNRASGPAPQRNATMKQLELLVNKVKWGLNLYDKDDVVNFITGAGINLATLKAHEVDAAITKLDEAVREAKVNGIAVKETKQDTVIQVDGGETISLDDIPY